jgi:hypothetical protein
MEVGDCYRHYKGNTYKILALAKHSETMEPLVIYQDLENVENIWARPQSMFEQTVYVEEKAVLRFTKI